MKCLRTTLQCLFAAFFFVFTCCRKLMGRVVQEFNMSHICVLQLSNRKHSPFCLFACHVSAVFSEWVPPHTHILSLRHLHSATAHKLVIQPKERRKDTAGGTSDAILTSNWKPSHSLFPIMRLCQAGEYKRDIVRDEGRDTEELETNWESKFRGKEEQKERAVGVWETERDGGNKSEKRKNRCQSSSSECNSWPGADAGLLGVFIDLQDFNPQYWPKLLAEGCWPTWCRLYRAWGKW